MTVRLQKQLAYKYKDKKHFKHVLVIPENAVNKLGWKAGQTFELDVEKSRLIIRPEKEDSER